MKKHIGVYALLFALMTSALTGCVSGGESSSTGSNFPSPGNTASSDTTGSNSSSEDSVIGNIELTALKASVDIKDIDVTGYDFTSLFSIESDGKKVEVRTEYVDTSAVSSLPGSYAVTCTYGNKFAVVVVNVVKTVYEVTLSKEEITINQSLVDSYNYSGLFTVTVDGEEKPITADMISSDVAYAVGTYSYTVSYGDASKTLKVNVTDDHDMEAIVTYHNIEIPVNDLDGYDYTRLFSLYEDGRAVQVTPDMVDSSALSDAQEGNSYEVVLTYQSDKSSVVKSATVKVVAAGELIINAKNTVIYPNSAFIDVTTLFEITKGNESIPVTIDMITGSIDYSSIGENEITLTYNGVTQTAVVEVRRGVILDYAKSDTVVVRKGTSKSTYSFVNDFSVSINGIAFDVPDSYLDASAVDFDNAGTYEATIRIPYNEDKVGLSGVKFTYYEKTITYVVVDNNYDIALQQSTVTLPKGTESFDVYSNLSVTINGRGQALTENASWVDVITCYVQTLSDPIDFNRSGAKEVQIAVYVNGPENAPEIVTYSVMIESDVVVTATDTTVFAGGTVYTKDLFSVTAGGESREITYDMIEGKVDTFTPGIYTVTIDYYGIVKEARVTVFDSAMQGTYHTWLITIATTEYTYDDEGYIVEDATMAVPLGDLVITADSITVNGKSAKILNGIDEYTMYIMVGTYEYMLYYDDGIVVLDPDNSIKLGYNENKRPMVYFNEAQWTIEEQNTVNYSDSHVLSLNYITYSIDTFKIRSTDATREMWYALKVELAERTSADTIYAVTWGEAVYADDYVNEAGAVSSVIFDDTEYPFTVLGGGVCKIRKTETEKLYANKTFTGTIDGKTAELRADQYEGYTLIVDSGTVFQVGSYDVGSMSNGSVDYVAGTIFLYQWETDVFSYKFNVDPEANTFTLIERDAYFGKYEIDGMYIFLDGYGTGYVNFNTSSYYKTQFRYTVNGSEISLRYFNTSPTFAYGKGATFYIGTLLNTLTVKEGVGFSAGTVFENSAIVDGAIVHISSYTVGADSDSVAKAQLLSNIEIITKDGALDAAAKANCVTTSSIRFSTPGYYQFTITLSVNGKSVVSYYAVQVLEAIYTDNPVVASYGAGVMHGENSLVIDKYGRATVNCSGTVYSGNVTIEEDYSFTIRAYNSTKAYISVTGTYIASGIVFVKCGGAVAFSDYFTTGTARASGTSGFILREFSVSGALTYILSSTASSAGEIVTVVSENGVSPSLAGAIVKVVKADGGESYAKIVSWDNTSDGLLLSDGYRGTYTSETGNDLVLDGFGGAVSGDYAATYTLNGNAVTVSTSVQIKVYRLDTETYTYEEVDVALDNSLVSGKTYSSTYKYTCGNYSYEATTSFEFGENGTVVIRSVSPTHDEGDYSCDNDTYSPVFASATGVTGSYSVSGNRLTVTVNGETFVFLIGNVLSPSSFTCQSTTLVSGDHGYFKVDTVFRT